MRWRRAKRRHASDRPPPAGWPPDAEWPPPIDWSSQAAYLPSGDAGPAELKPKLDILAEQQEAIRDILFLYWRLSDSRGISGDDQVGRGHFGSFDPWRWLQCEADYDGGVWRSYDDALLLRQGSAVALLSELLGDWDREGSSGELWKIALAEGRFDHLPAARRAVQAGLEGPDEMYAHLDVVYDEYVLAFFEMLASEGRPGEGGASGKARPRSTFREPR